MEQRPLRLGDVVDDYCPRERRITNHVVVAIVEDAIRQTRCSTCDAEHVYKDARPPRRRKTGGDTADDALAAELTNGQLVIRTADDDLESVPEGPEAAADSPESPAVAAGNGNGHAGPADDGWPAHRRLIRASLPKTDGELPPPRPIPEFTMHQRQGRGGGPFSRHAQPHWNGNGNGNGRENNGNSFGGPGQPNGNGRPGPRNGKSGRRRRGKRPR
jgi:hypothetical protein